MSKKNQPIIDEGRVLSEEEVEALKDQYEPPLTRKQINEKRSIPFPDRSHFDRMR